jgi:putative CocE/NonD family hydrolase
VLVIGPWNHAANAPVAGVDYGPDATIDMEGVIVRWFDRYLKGVDNGVDREPPVRVFVMGENRWYAEDDWPLPQTVFTRYYLASSGVANSLKGDGVLTTTPPADEASDSYVYDPRAPTLDASNGYHAHNGHLDGPLDTRLSAIGDDVLVYQTAPLEAPLEVTGPIEATLYAATSAADTDWFVRLVDVHPDGRSLLLADGALRARSSDPENEGRFNAARLTSIEPGTITRYTIRFWRGTANLFLPGHRIRIEISSSWFPYFLPNLNTGADNLALVPLSDAVVARQTIHHGPSHASHVLLPVIPSRGGG